MGTGTELRTRIQDSVPGIHVVAKPIGPVCNIQCDYCFYLEKQALFRAGEQYRMPDKVLGAFIAKYVASQPTPVVEFVWQGGEPTLLGIDFFKRVVELQKPFAKDKRITNSLQTNGTLLDEEWCRFLKRHNFMVGISSSLREAGRTARHHLMGGFCGDEDEQKRFCLNAAILRSADTGDGPRGLGS